MKKFESYILLLSFLFGVNVMKQKIFISVPMNGRSNEAIRKHIENIKVAAKNYFNMTEVEFTDNFECDFDPERCIDLKHPRIGYLAEAVKKLAYCDGVIFGNGYTLSSGCNVEYSIAEEYEMDVYYEDEDGDICNEVW